MAMIIPNASILLVWLGFGMHSINAKLRPSNEYMRHQQQTKEKWTKEIRKLAKVCYCADPFNVHSFLFGSIKLNSFISGVRSINRRQPQQQRRRQRRWQQLGGFVCARVCLVFWLNMEIFMVLNLRHISDSCPNMDLALIP